MLEVVAVQKIEAPVLLKPYYDVYGFKRQQQYGILVDSKGNNIINNYIAGNAKAAIKAVDGNTVTEWESTIPLTPETLVEVYDSGHNGNDHSEN